MANQGDGTAQLYRLADNLLKFLFLPYLDQHFAQYVMVDGDFQKLR